MKHGAVRQLNGPLPVYSFGDLCSYHNPFGAGATATHLDLQHSCVAVILVHSPCMDLPV